MFRDLPRYDEYRSNVSPWLGDLPKHWLLARTKTLLAERTRKGYPEEPLLAATQRHGVIKKSDYENRTVTATKDLHLLKLVEVGDFVISLRSFQGGIERCYHRGIISPAYTVLTAKDEAHREFLAYLFKSRPYVDSLTLAVTGIREGQNIDYSRLEVDLLPVPPAEEQAAIVKYLTYANTRIDKAIVAKRRLIALLDEQIEVQRATLLNGLGVPQRLATVIWEGPTNGTSPEISESGDLETFSISVVKEGVIDVRQSDIKYVERSSVRDVSKYRLRTGDTLMVRGNGNIKLVGRAGLVSAGMGDRIYPDLLMRLRFRPHVDPRFMVAVLNSATVREQIENTVRTAVGTYKLSGADVRGLLVPVPGPSEQKAIVRELDELEKPKSQMSVMLTREIGLLQEFRTRLVADVVTGQVDVRAVAATLPDAALSATVTDEVLMESDDLLEDGDE